MTRKQVLIGAGIGLVALVAISVLADPPSEPVAQATPTATQAVEPTAPTASPTPSLSPRPTPTPTPSSRPTPLPTVGQWQQTWTISYRETTCVHWADQMDAHQQRVMAGDMLLGAQRSQQPDAGIPPLSQIVILISAINEVCENEGYEIGMHIAEIVSLLYLMSDDLKP